MNSTERAFSEKLDSLISDGAKVLVAFSGGCDSLALLCLCTSTLGAGRVSPVYVNHRLRPDLELQSEIALNRSNCETLGLELIVRDLDEGEVKRLAETRGGGIEDAARALRYKVLEDERVRTSSSFILTAHHRQDQIETLMMRLSKGSPISSLRGIAARDDERHLVRPLLNFNRVELEQYLISKNLKWSTDSTNSDAYFQRNSIRNDVIPQIKAIFPDYENCIINLGKQAEALSDVNLSSIGPCVEVSVFNGINPVARSLVLFSMWNSVFKDREMPMSLAERVLEAVEADEDSTIGSSGGVFFKYHGCLYLTDPSEDSRFSSFDRILDADIDKDIALPGGLVFHMGLDIEPEKFGIPESKALRFDISKTRGAVHLRFAREGDRIRLRNGAKMVLRLLQDMKIPAPLRCRVPVMVDDDGVCAVFGSPFGGRDRICAKFVTSLARNQFPLYIVSKG